MLEKDTKTPKSEKPDIVASGWEYQRISLFTNYIPKKDVLY